METITAIARLGGARDMASFLDFPDSALGADPTDFQRAVTAVAGLPSARKVGTVIAPWHADPHPEHMAASRIAAAACGVVHAAPRQLHYAVLPWACPASEHLPPYRLALDARRHVVRRAWALRAHRSQLGLLPDMGVGFVLPKRLCARAEQPMEYYFEVSAEAVAA
jgi:LmbE family N-acetylglucosaminyl deacetylase